MCGICGGRFREPEEGSLDPQAVVRRMSDIQRHRGPDDEGFFSQGPLHLGFRRLSIIDLDTGHQPLGNEDGSIQVILNGEIYNFRELRAELEPRHTFRTHTDTEVIAHLYEDLGVDCFARLNGMFGIAILDLRNDRLVLARDRAGVKPLYYARCGRDFAFASEVKALLEHPDCPRAVDATALASYLGVQYVPGPRTMFEGIWSLNPGNRLVLEGDGEPRIDAYWTLPPIDPEHYFTDRSVCAGALHDLVRDAVRMRLVSDVPLGALLSGGLDSSIVVGLMAEMSSGPVKTISVGFADDARLDETADAHATARHFGTDHYEIRYGRDEALRALPLLVWHNELPVAEPLVVPSYFLFQEARRHVTVVLSGEGADELFGGYMRYRLLSELRRLRPFMPGAGWRGWDLLRAGRGHLHAMGKLGQALAEPSPAQSLWEWNCLWSEDELAGVLVDSRRTGTGSAHTYRMSDGLRTNSPPAELANHLMGIECENRLVDYILGRADKMSMANSLELRTPFLDYRLIEFAQRIPSRWKLDAGGEKRILREAFAGLLPRDVVRRRKRAFQSPYRSWLEPMAQALVPESRLVQDGWVRRDGLMMLVREFGRSERAMKRLWTVLMLEMWYRTFLSREELPAFLPAPARPPRPLSRLPIETAVASVSMPVP